MTEHGPHRRRSMLATLLALAMGLGAGLSAQPPGPVRVFIYSRDSAAGFNDDRLAAFRRDLGKELESLMEIGYGRDDADLEVMLLGNGTLTLELAAGGEERQLFQVDEDAPKMWALLRVREFVKPFSVEGRGARDTARLAKTIGDWLKANQTSLRGKLTRPGG